MHQPANNDEFHVRMCRQVCGDGQAIGDNRQICSPGQGVGRRQGGATGSQKDCFAGGQQVSGSTSNAGFFLGQRGTREFNVSVFSFIALRCTAIASLNETLLRQLLQVTPDGGGANAKSFAQIGHTHRTLFPQQPRYGLSSLCRQHWCPPVWF